MEPDLEKRVASHRRYRRSPQVREYYVRQRMVKDAKLLLRLKGYRVKEVPQDSQEYGWTVCYPPLNIERRIKSDSALISYAATEETETILHRMGVAEKRYGPTSDAINTAATENETHNQDTAS